MTNAIELLKSAATTGFVGGQNPVDIFYNKIDTRSLWFRKDGAGYVVRIGRNAFEIAGSKLFRAEDLDGVVAILNALLH